MRSIGKRHEALQGGVRMTPERWPRVKSLFERALDQPAAARDAFLDAAGESPSVVAEVRKLLSGDAMDCAFHQVAEFLALLIGDGGSQILHLDQSLADEHHLGDFGNARHPRVANQLRV